MPIFKYLVRGSWGAGVISDVPDPTALDKKYSEHGKNYLGNQHEQLDSHHYNYSTQVFARS